MGPLNCPFCDPDKKEIVVENDLAYGRYDKYPVNPGHMLIIPKRHFPNYFDATLEEKEDILALIDETRNLIDKIFHPDGYTIGINVGEVAGQTVMHLHVHLIPRYEGDVEDPKGGVRGVIPEKRDY
jgi:diadenosine tetraphosphate (Ap4A) HIT family hydrolase